MTAALQLYGAYAILLSLLSMLLAILSTDISLRLAKLSLIHLQTTMKIGLLVTVLAPLLVKLSPSPKLLISSGHSFTANSFAPNSRFLIPASSAIQSAITANFIMNWGHFLCVILWIGFAFQFWTYYRDLQHIQNFLQKATPLRRIGQVCVLAFEGSGVAFAFHSFRTAYVFVPESFCNDSELFTLSVRHELQHHRQNDTMWVYVWKTLQALYFWHPGVHFLVHRISEVQELACDEALLGRADVSINAYSRCLFKAAQSAVKNQRMLVGTTGMTTGSSCKKLKRRIEMMLRTQVKSNPLSFGTIMILTASMLTTLAFATERLTQRNDITLHEVQTIISEHTTSEFPLEVNSEILNELNIFVGTEDGRQLIRTSLERRALYRETFAQQLISKVPAELEAIALVESGFQNLPENINAPHSAGMWQFIPQTARNFGLRVDETIDERLDISRSTDAAARLLASLQLRFQDWRLAILAYNAGESRIQEGIDKIHSRNPWELIRSGFCGDPNYLAKVMAGALLTKNPDWVLKD